MAPSGPTVATVGDAVVVADDRRFAVSERVASTAAERFETADAVRAVVRRPTVALSMKRIVEAGAAAGSSLEGSQRAAHERTLLELCALDADDADDGPGATTDCILDRIRDTVALPGSRAVRRQAATVRRANGSEIRDNDWLVV